MRVKKAIACNRSVVVLATNIIISLIISTNLLHSNDVPRASRIFLSQNCNIFTVLNIFKRNPGKTNDKFLAPVNDIYPVIYRREEIESDELLNTVRSLVTVRNQLSARVIKAFNNRAVIKNVIFSEERFCSRLLLLVLR